MSTYESDCLSLSRNGDRKPLGTLHTENLIDSTESLTKTSKSEILKETTEHALFCTQTNAMTLCESIEHHVYKHDDTPAPDGTVHSAESEELDPEHAVKYCADVTLKSYDCDGGEVEISDVLVKADDTIPLPQTEISEYPPHVHTLDSSNVMDSTGYCNTEDYRTDHAYCRRESGASDRSFTECFHDKPWDALGDITLKFLNCSGGEIEIADSVHLFDRTIPLPTDQPGEHVKSFNSSVNISFFAKDGDSDHLDHPYCNIVRADNASVSDQSSIHEVLDETEQLKSKSEHKESISPLTQDQNVECPNGSIKADSEKTSFISEDVQLFSPNPQIDSTVLNDHNKSMEVNVTKQTINRDVSALAIPQHTTDSHHQTTLTVHTDVKEEEDAPSHSQAPSCSQMHQGRDTADSALGMSPNALAPAEPPQADEMADVLKAFTESTPLQLKFLSPFVRRASLALKQTQKELVADLLEDDDCGLVRDKPVPSLDHAELWREHFDSPMSLPLFNSTELVPKSKACTIPDVILPGPEVNNQPAVEIPVFSEGPLQQQLKQMAEFLMLASRKIDPTSLSAPVAQAAKVEYHNASVGTSPLRLINHSVNTSGHFERKRSFSVEDQCTLTDPLLWNVPVDNLESVSRSELEQRALSSMIIAEALAQQLAAARAHTLPPVGTAPSNLRDKTVQTDHTELSQTSLHRDLYLEALGRINELEMDKDSLENLAHYMKDVKVTMGALATETDAALYQMKQMEQVVKEDHSSLASNYGQMKSLLEKSRESQMRMVQKVKAVLQEKENMHNKMEEAFSAKEAAHNVMDQLRKHCSMEISELEKCVGSQQELLSALKKANPEQVSLNKAYSETLNVASDLLSRTMKDQFSLAKELCSARGLLQKSAPILLRLNKKADAALRDCDKHKAERDQALQDKEQTEEELSQVLQSLQNAKEHIGDLNLQVTILTSEMGVLRQKLSEGDEERAQLDRKATELSATVSSTLASYAFLEQALSSESAKLQQSWADIKQTKERADELEFSLSLSEQHVSELSQTLGHSEKQVRHLQSVAEAQALQLQQLQEKCSQLSGVREMNEFLQVENELSREQIAESERMLSLNLQSLRERNIQCEDLNGELRQLQLEKKNMEEELDCVRTKFTACQTEHKEQLEEIVTEIVILHHTVRSVTNELQASLKEGKPDQLTPNTSSSFVDSVTVPLTSDEDESPVQAPSNAVAQSEIMFSENSAFTRITAITPKRSSMEREAEERQSNVSELLVGLSSTLSELRNNLTSVQQQNDVLLKDKHQTICDLERKLEAAQRSHQTEVSELQFQLSRTNARMERVNATLQQKTQDEKTVSKLLGEISDIQEMLNKHKADNNELRKEVVELRRSVQQSKSEAHFLRDELMKHSGQSLPPADFMEEKIALLKEMEKLKMSVQDAEQARKKLLERAKRHQAIYETNQQKSEKELQLLNNMLNKVRETLLALPETVSKCEQLQQLMEYVG